MRAARSVVIIAFMFMPLCGCDKATSPPPPNKKLQIVATLFPVYDMARAISGADADVTLLLPPGNEAHGYEPQPEAIMRIQHADLFVYTHRAMEPWAERLAATLDRARVTTVAAGNGIETRPANTNDQHAKQHDHGSDHGEETTVDPHLWLDFDNAGRMTDTIAMAMIARDPEHGTSYRVNADRYKRELRDLDILYRTTLADCPNRVLLQGGHFAFGYLAQRYRLDYHAAAAVSPDAEPTPARLAELVETMRRLKLHTIFSEELVSPRLAETIARETGATIRPLNAGHNVSRSDLSTGVTFPELMRRNLSHLKEGLSCR